VAVKVLRAEFSQDPALIGRFLNEARAANAIRHPNIIEILDSGTAAGAPYLVMELLEGETLKARLQRLGRLPVDVALEFAYQTASAVGAAHRKAIVHRDLKPDNLFIIAEPTDPARERVKVLDFGIAKLQVALKGDSVRTRTGTLMGTPVYMSPEQCLGTREIDSRSDIYSLGVILYEMVCGQPPFFSEGFGELVNMHLNLPPAPPRTLAPDLPEAVEEVILKMLAKDVAHRYGSMYEVQAALKAISEGRVHGSSRPKFSGGTLPAGTMALPAPERAGPQTTTFSTGSGERIETPSRARRPALAALLLVAAGAVTAGVLWRKAPPPVVTVTADAAVVVAAPAPPPPPPVRKVHLGIASEPAGARVVDVADGQVRGRTPLDIEVPAADSALEVRLEKQGYKPARLSLPRATDRSVTVELTAMPRPHHHPAKVPQVEEPAKL
jgi:serine/threonine-protein kinase